MIKFKLILSIVATALSCSLSNSQSLSLFSENAENGILFQNEINKELSKKDVQKVQLLRAQVASLKATELSITIFDSIEYTPKQKWFVKNENGYEVWAGNQENLSADQAFLIQKDGRITGQLIIDGKTYFIRNINGAVHIIVEIDQSKINDRCTTSPTVLDSTQVKAADSISKSGGRRQTEPIDKITTPNNSTNLNLK